jgi:hypothetical protein
VESLDVTTFQASPARAAWFTDSLKPVLYRVPLAPGGLPGAPSSVQTVELGGDYVHGPVSTSTASTPRRTARRSSSSQSSTGNLFAVSQNGEANAIALAGGESVPMGDGILLTGRTLYVVQNRLNLVAKIALTPDLESGRVLERISNPGFDVPTTIAHLGRRLYAVNARFRTPPQPPLPQPADYWVTQLRK